MARRPQMTTADYVTIAVSPALIMTLVGSLVFFLLEVFYQGQYHARLQFILALFVFAAVLIGRISIVEGAQLASLYGLALAVVTWVAINRFVAFQTSLSPLINTFLIAIIWWCSHKLTWDCTLIEESEDDTGEGLLQAAGLEQANAAEGETDEPDAKEKGPDFKEPEEPVGTTAPDAPLMTWWQRLAEERRRPHTPGVWVLYFSLAALPIFGLGQRFIPAGNIESRQAAFDLLCVYVASGLGLLLTTSFLSLRRYLRGRQLQMPSEMAGTWLAIGCVLIGVLLLIAAIIPRPEAEYAISRLPFRMTSPANLSASRYAPGRDGAKDEQRLSRSQVERQDEDTESRTETLQNDSAEQDNQPTRKPGKGKPGKGKSHEGKSHEGKSHEGKSHEGKSHEGKPSESKPSESKPSESKSSDAQQSDRRHDDSSDRATPSDDASPRGDEGTQSNDKSPSSPNSSSGRSRRDSSRNDETSADRQRREQSRRDESRSSTQSSRNNDEPQSPSLPRIRLALAASLISALLKTIIYVVIITFALVLLWVYRHEVLSAIDRLADELRELWARLFGRKPDAQGGDEEDEAGATATSPRPFADFVDPFATGRADRLAPEELVRYSFAAFEAWARENGTGRLPDQTPHELARKVSARDAALSDDARRVARLYSQVAYAPDHLPRADVESLRQLWWRMSR